MFNDEFEDNDPLNLWVCLLFVSRVPPQAGGVMLTEGGRF